MVKSCWLDPTSCGAGPPPFARNRKEGPDGVLGLGLIARKLLNCDSIDRPLPEMEPHRNVLGAQDQQEYDALGMVWSEKER